MKPIGRAPGSAVDCNGVQKPARYAGVPKKEDDDDDDDNALTDNAPWSETGTPGGQVVRVRCCSTSVGGC